MEPLSFSRMCSCSRPFQLLYIILYVRRWKCPILLRLGQKMLQKTCSVPHYDAWKYNFNGEFQKVSSTLLVYRTWFALNRQLFRMFSKSTKGGHLPKMDRDKHPFGWYPAIRRWCQVLNKHCLVSEGSGEVKMWFLGSKNARDRMDGERC